MRKRVYIPILVILISVVVVSVLRHQRPVLTVRTTTSFSNDQLVSEKDLKTERIEADPHIVKGHGVSVIMSSIPSSTNSPHVVTEAELRQRIQMAQQTQQNSH